MYGVVVSALNVCLESPQAGADMNLEEEALKFYRSLVNEEFVESLTCAGKVSRKGGVFPAAVTVWLMIFQRLHPRHTLSAALEQILDGKFVDMLDQRILRARNRGISGSTGGYSRARSRLPVESVEKAADKINGALITTHCEQTWKGRRVFAIDGSTLRTSYTPENCEEFPRYKNQYGEAHFPLVRFGVATDVVTGVSLRPAYGAYNGSERTDEFALAEEFLPRIPQGSVVIGDRYYGCPRFIATAQASRLDVVCRVKEKNVERYLGKALSRSGEEESTWISTRSRAGDERYEVKGKFVWHTTQPKGFRPQRMVYFTTLALSAAEVIELYKQRWKVELDLRDIKSTLEMHTLKTKTPEMMAKELILGFCAYNLIRHLMIAPAKRLKLSPRELSFSRVLTSVCGMFLNAKPDDDSERRQAVLRSFLVTINHFKLPKRTTPRTTEPRKVWRKGETGFMKGSREEERQKIQKKRTLTR